MAYLRLLLLAIALAVGASLSAQETKPIVIIHGAWGGAHHWKAVDDILSHDHGFSVHRISLTGLGERSHLASPEVNLSTHIRDVTNKIEFDDLKDIVLVGHSYGGVVATGVADAIADRIGQIVYLDAVLPIDGESFGTNDPKRMQVLTKRAKEDGDGWLVPVDWPNPMRDTPHPLATLLEPIKLTNKNLTKVPATYWLFADGQPPEKDERYLYYKRAEDRGWPVKTFPWDHNPQRSRPGDLTKELANFLKQSN